MKKLQDGAAFVFIICVVVLTVVSVLGIWKIFDADVIGKSLKTIGLLASVAAVVIVVGKFMDSRETQNSSLANIEPSVNPAFISIRSGTVVVLVVSVVLIAFLGVLSIWEILSGDVLNKSLSSMAVLGFAFLVIIMTCLVCEGYKFRNKKISSWSIVLMVIVAWIVLRLLFNLN